MEGMGMAKHSLVNLPARWWMAEYEEKLIRKSLARNPL